MGAAQQPSVAVWEPSRNQRLTRFRALAVNLLKIKESSQKASARQKRLRLSAPNTAERTRPSVQVNFIPSSQCGAEECRRESPLGELSANPPESVPCSRK